MGLGHSSVDRSWRAPAYVAMLLAVACPRSEPAEISEAAAAECRVASIGDGDSLNCRDGRRMRLLLIDAPELAQPPYGDRARAALVDLAPVGTRLRVEYDVERTDRYGRHLVYLYAPGDAFLSEEMVARGFAVALVIRPNGRHEATIRAAETRARAAGRGLWAVGGFACRPADFRARRCGAGNR